MSEPTHLIQRATPWLVVAVVSAFAVPAFAQADPTGTANPGFKKAYAEEKTGNGSNVVFDDDQALGTAYDPFADIVKGRPLGARLNLLRPRYNFVPEMLKSVENL